MLYVCRAGVHSVGGKMKGYRPVTGVAMLALAIAVGCARKPDDAALVNSIKSQMESDSLLKDADLRVSSSQGEVTISGPLSSDAVRMEAYKIAAKTPGVVKVTVQMPVPTAAAPAEPALSVAAARPVDSAAVHSVREKKKAGQATEEMKAVGSTAQQHTNTPMQMHGTYLTTVAQPAPPQLAASPAQAAVRAPALPTPPPAPPAPPQPKDVVVPGSSMMRVRMIDSVDSAVNHPGEIFHAALESPMVVDGTVVVPRGADIYVRLASSKKAGRLKGKSELHLELLKLEFQGRSYSLYSSTYTAAGDSRGKQTAKKVGSGAAIGAVIGAIAGAGAGAAIGAGVGAGAGAVLTGMTRGKQVKIPSESMLDFELEQPVTVTVMPRSTATSSAQ
jgi:hypothetical protein